MNYKKIIIIISLICVSFFSATASDSKTDNNSKLTVKVSGMVCTSCERDIEQTFEARKEVKSVDAIFDEKSIKLEFKEGMEIPKDEIKNIVADLGYSVTSFN